MDEDVQLLSDEAIALTDALTGLIEVFLATGVRQEVFDQIYGTMRDDKLKIECVKGASIMEALRQFATDPGRATHREVLRKPPQGSA